MPNIKLYIYHCIPAINHIPLYIYYTYYVIWILGHSHRFDHFPVQIAMHWGYKDPFSLNRNSLTPTAQSSIPNGRSDLC